MTTDNSTSTGPATPAPAPASSRSATPDTTYDATIPEYTSSEYIYESPAPSTEDDEPVQPVRRSKRKRVVRSDSPIFERAPRRRNATPGPVYRSPTPPDPTILENFQAVRPSSSILPRADRGQEHRRALGLPEMAHAEAEQQHTGLDLLVDAIDMTGPAIPSLEPPTRQPSPAPVEPIPTTDYTFHFYFNRAPLVLISDDALFDTLTGIIYYIGDDPDEAQ